MKKKNFVDIVVELKNEYQKNLSSTDLEIKAIILVLEKFQLFLNQE